MLNLSLVNAVQYFFLCYFIAINACYLALSISAFLVLNSYLKTRIVRLLPRAYLGLEPPVSILVPAYNESAIIVNSIYSLLQLEYPEYEIIVINDGSSDRTLEILIQEFNLEPFPYAYCDRLPTQEIAAIYRSTTYPNLRIIDKKNGGKSDALRAGINLAQYPLFCGVDADSILQRQALWYLAQPFMEDSNTVAAGGIIRIANGCAIEGGYLVQAGLPKNPLALFQVLEYFRGFLLGRLGWSAVNAMLIISGAFGLFHKETVVAIGGYESKTIGEDMELVVHLHYYLSQRGKPYRIAFAPEAVCWTECPEDLGTLQNQRVRWQRGLCESLELNPRLLLHPKGGAAAWLAFPYMFLFEVLSGITIVAGYLFVGLGLYLGFISFSALQVFLLIEISFGIVISLNALFLEEIAFHVYPKFQHLLLLFLVAILENFGYRQLNTFWRLIGIWRWLTRSQARWGRMKRKGY